MEREEVITHIEHREVGTRDLAAEMKESKSPDASASMIGQFGVGFYSAFMAADLVTLVTAVPVNARDTLGIDR